MWRCLIMRLVATTVAATPAFAQDPGRACMIYGPPYQLSSDTVTWTLTIGSGQSCVRGIRSMYATLDEVSLAAPAETGQVKVSGTGFVYRTGSDFRGDDAFSLAVSGKLNNVSGNSTIRVNVSVR